MFNYKKILVVVFDKNKSNKALKEVQQILADNACEHEVFLEEKEASGYKGYDLVLVIGGDGSMLSAAKLFSHLNCPFLGINLGKVGFMADLDSENLTNELPEVLSGKNLLEEKETLSCIYNGEEYTAFNEIVLHTQKSYKLMHFELKIEDNLIYRKRADGLIISTSNGSTAYSLSAGGPILSPEVKGLVITSLNPLSLSARPLIVPSDSKIEVNLIKTPSDLIAL